ncbi:hypothetical protein [Cellulomonas wangsupingiae]|uniref:Butirosin biosynthesis protein H N-terminal domain-containing protein n=1 Tax=Cellulomonas wangsupingiae TaxID=2968085 RepID=A0ABY5KAF8_9CELL|nr:hypothetical protein [Cellulomonas wangsupingiae]MCC2333037.1 hypothetical protein [Cellulomonas wangsupingiae]UUI66753.1 hypothetical protein NP075_08670 [Cellulomonas wangsupingiae]
MDIQDQVTTLAMDAPRATLGLSCYTANLERYLSHEWDGPALIARSVRLAVGLGRQDGLLAFSHHDPALDALPDGTHLRHAGAASVGDALAGIADEVRSWGRALVVADASRLPWAPPGVDPGPHWLLVDGRRTDAWHVVDAFAALLPQGAQASFDGWLGTDVLARVLDLPERPGPWPEVHRLRDELAFGAVVEPGPHGRARWLTRTALTGPVPGPDGGLPGRWLTTDEETLPFLAEHLVAEGARAARQLEDVWAVAGHRAFAHGWALAHGTAADPARAAHARTLWERLPRDLRYAVTAAQRGRARPDLVRDRLARVMEAEVAAAGDDVTTRVVREGEGP